MTSRVSGVSAGDLPPASCPAGPAAHGPGATSPGSGPPWTPRRGELGPAPTACCATASLRMTSLSLWPRQLSLQPGLTDGRSSADRPSHRDSRVPDGSGRCAARQLDRSNKPATSPPLVGLAGDARAGTTVTAAWPADLLQRYPGRVAPLRPRSASNNRRHRQTGRASTTLEPRCAAGFNYQRPGR